MNVLDLAFIAFGGLLVVIAVVGYFISPKADE